MRFECHMCVRDAEVVCMCGVCVWGGGGGGLHVTYGLTSRHGIGRQAAAELGPGAEHGIPVVVKAWLGRYEG